jgi:hypothetical protein
MLMPALLPARPMPRMLVWLLLYVALFAGAAVAQKADPGGLLAVTLFKAHLMALGGWGGYWLDRALFPYDRPHQYLELDDSPDEVADDLASAELVAGNAFTGSMLRRAVVVAACLICVGLGA